MSATRRLYRAMAGALADAKPLNGDSKPAHRAWEETVLSLADTLKEGNSSFRYDLFLKAAGHPEWADFTD